MMAYIFEDGRILYDSSLLTESDEEKYIYIKELPKIEKIDGKIGTITGCNLKTKEIKIEYFDIPPEPEPEPEPIPQPTEQDLLNAQILLNQAEQDAKLKEIDETLALLLLNQEGGF